MCNKRMRAQNFQPRVEENKDEAKDPQKKEKE